LYPGKRQKKWGRNAPHLKWQAVYKGALRGANDGAGRRGRGDGSSPADSRSGILPRIQRGMHAECDFNEKGVARHCSTYNGREGKAD